MVKNWYISKNYKATKKEIQVYQSPDVILLLLACMTRPDIPFGVEE